MQKTIGVLRRGLACALMLAGLAACNDDESSSRDPAPAAVNESPPAPVAQNPAPTNPMPQQPETEPEVAPPDDPQPAPAPEVDAEPTSVTLSWQPPLENTDGSPLVNLNGYKIHYGTQSGNYTETVTVTNPGITRYVVENLLPGTYYFAVTAVAGNGTESDLSGEAGKTI